MNTTVLGQPIKKLENRPAVGAVVRRAVHECTAPALITRVTALLSRVQQIGAHVLTVFPTAILDHVQAGVRDWADDDSVPNAESRMLDHLPSSTARLTPSPSLNLGSSWQ